VEIEGTFEIEDALRNGGRSRNGICNAERYGLVRCEEQEGLGDHKAAHGVADQDGMDGGVDGGGGGGVGDFNVDHLVLEPVYRISAMVEPKTRASTPFAKPSHVVFNSPLVLNLG
jgi:hypothetical protein